MTPTPTNGPGGVSDPGPRYPAHNAPWVDRPEGAYDLGDFIRECFSWSHEVRSADHARLVARLSRIERSVPSREYVQQLDTAIDQALTERFAHLEQVIRDGRPELDRVQPMYSAHWTADERNNARGMPSPEMVQGLFEQGYRQGWTERDTDGHPRYPGLTKRDDLGITSDDLREHYDRGVADGRASAGGVGDAGYALGKNHGARDAELAEARGFERGKAIGRSEAEAELLNQGWTPPGGVIIGMAESRDDLIEAGWIPPGAVEGVRHELNAYEVWRDALTAAGSQRNRRELERETVLADAVWFWDRLISGPPGLKGEYLRPMDESSAQIVEPLGTVLKNDDGTDTEGTHQTGMDDDGVPYARTVPTDHSGHAETESGPFGTYPGHDPTVTVGGCWPGHPCPSCRARVEETRVTETEAAANPADLGDHTTPQDPNNPTSAY